MTVQVVKPQKEGIIGKVAPIAGAVVGGIGGMAGGPLAAAEGAAMGASVGSTLGGLAEGVTADNDPGLQQTAANRLPQVAPVETTVATAQDALQELPKEQQQQFGPALSAGAAALRRTKGLA
jgi:hypothetical protein